MNGFAEYLNFLGTLNSTHPAQAYANISPAYRESIHPFPSMIWLGGVNDAQRILTLANTANTKMFQVKDKALAFGLLASCCTEKHSLRWIKPAAGNHDGTIIDVIAQYFDIGVSDAAIYVERYSVDDIMEMAGDLGLSDVELKKLKDELKYHGPREVKTSSRPSKKRSSA